MNSKSKEGIRSIKEKINFVDILTFSTSIT